MSPIGRKRLIVFAKSPQPGAVKTRLIPCLGALGAAQLHMCLVEHAMVTARQAGCAELELHGAERDDEFLVACAQRHGARFLPQDAGGLGQRMHSAFVQALTNEGCSAVVLIGSDCPALCAHHLEQALERLAAGNDAVIGPAEDGGYALIGLARVDARLFEGIAWGTERVLTQTRTRLQTLGWRWHELETLWDVDRPADYHRLIRSGLLPHPAMSSNE